MNRSQKNAWFGLINCLLAICFFGFLLYRGLYYVPVPGFRGAPEPMLSEIIFRFLIQWGPLVIPILAIILLLVPRKKQSPNEPSFDEFDRAIRNKAITVSFISLWLLYPIAYLLIGFKTNSNGLVSIAECLYIHLGIFFVCMTIYFLATLLLYKKHTEGGLT